MTVADVTEKPLDALLSLTGRTAVVTGGARGIGAATARRLAEAGADVVIADVDLDAAEETAASLDGTGTARATRLDVTVAGAAAACADEVVATEGRLDVWVNNAGIYPVDTLLETTDEQWDRVLDVNLRATFVASRDVGRRMVEARRGGVIVNVASGAGLQTALGLSAHYCVSKAGVIMLTKNLALELGPHDVRVLGVAPGLVLTETVRTHEAYKDLDEILSPTLPLRRSCVPDDIARVILFCASDLSAIMTGHTILADSGQLLV